MKIVFLGSTQYSQQLLLHLLEHNFQVNAIFTIPNDFSISYSKEKVKNYNFADLQGLSVTQNIPCYLVDSKNNQRITDYYDEIASIKPDVILVLGWYFMVPKKIRELARYGAWGIHASLLPKYAGGAPLSWAIINGEKTTGVTLFKLDDGVDDGDIIAQEEITIEYEDSIKEVYDKATIVSKSILLHALQNADCISPIAQNKAKIEVYPQRSPEDGEIDTSWTAEKMYNFIRAQAPPYPGAFIRTSDGKKIIIHKASVAD